MAYMNIDERYMRIAITLAKRREGLTNPNPVVGAVVVKNKKIVGRGWHERCGLPHAEVNALRSAGSRAKGATLYVSLEPCDHFGRTPPCTDAIIKSGIKEVVIGMKDPNPVNNGRGIKKLNSHKIKTLAGILEDEAKSINKPYIKFITKKMPYVTVKVAQSLDGKIATRTGASKWITSEPARQYVHELRSKVDAVMVGANTVAKDDPLLLSKIRGAKQPVRIVVAGSRKIPRSAKVFTRLDISPVIIARARSKGKGVDLKVLLKKLAQENIMHILVEGGGELIASLVAKRLVDRFLFFIAPKIIGGHAAKTSVEGTGIKNIDEALCLKNVIFKRFKNDILIEAEAG